MLEGRKDPSKVGLMYLCTFTLLKLSGERNFGVSLNKPYQLRLPVDVPLFNGNHSDLLVTSNTCMYGVVIAISLLHIQSPVSYRSSCCTS